MEKLDKVIASLIGCTVANCSNCEYGSGMCDMDQMMRDAAELLQSQHTDIETLHRINEDWRSEVARLHKRIDEARAEGARLAPVAEACEKPRTNYQRIKKMGPLYMANWIYHMKAVCDCCEKHYICGIPDDEVTDEYCLEHILMWLAQEANDD